MLLDHGHPDARLYPLGMLWDESNLVIERVNGTMVTEANLLQNAIGSILSSKSRKHFSDLLDSLNVITRPIGDPSNNDPFVGGGEDDPPDQKD